MVAELVEARVAVRQAQATGVREVLGDVVAEDLQRPLDAGSGGDFMPYAFKRTGLGPLIGKRTWGGLIGISANPGLIDGGFLVVPFFRFFTPEGEWRIENEGVSPDIDVDLDPVAVNAGRDVQLEAAVANVMERLKTWQPIQRTVAPPMPTQLGK